MRHCLFLFVLLLTSCAAKPTESCFIDVPVYDPYGNQLPYKVSRVFFEDGSRTFDLLGRTIDGITVTTRGSRIFWTSTSRSLTGIPLKVTLTHPKKKSLTEKIYAGSCQSRWSIVSARLYGGFDVAWIGIKGRLTGCRFSSDWRIRVIPMFGGQEVRVGEEGYVQDDGTFGFGYSSGTGAQHNTRDR